MQCAPASAEEIAWATVALCPIATAISIEYCYPDDTDFPPGAITNLTAGVQALINQLQNLPQPPSATQIMAAVTAAGGSSPTGATVANTATVVAKRTNDGLEQTFTRQWNAVQSSTAVLVDMIREIKVWAGAAC